MTASTVVPAIPRKELQSYLAGMPFLMASCADELADPGRHGLTFTLVQTWAVVD